MAVSIISIAALAVAHIPQTSAQIAPAPPTPTQKTPTELPSSPRGKSTVIGGDLRKVDPVRDQITLKVFGAKKPLIILFDERTQAFRDGNKISVLNLRDNEHASIETILDGTKIFALRIHTLTHLPQGDGRGQVVSFDSGSGQLMLNATSVHQPLNVVVPPGTPIVRVGQLAAGGSGTSGSINDLTAGALVNVRFKSGEHGTGTATGIDIIAIPGAAFVFEGTLGILDMKAGLLVLAGAENSGTQEITFDPIRFPATKDLHEGQTLKVGSTFDGTRYVATSISVE